MKALIITYYWPPAGGSGVQRWLKFVKYLKQFNIEPIVYTVANASYPKEDLQLEQEISKEIEVLKQPIWEPTDIMFWKKNDQQKKDISNTTNSGVLSFIRGNFFIPDPKVFWVNSSVKFLNNYLKSNPVDVVISTGPPHSMHLIAEQIRKINTLKWIADFRDPWTDLYYQKEFKQLFFARRKNEKLENRVLKNADCILTVSDSLKTSFLKKANRVEVITNGFDNEVLLEEHQSLDKKFTISYIGLLPKQSNPKILFQVLDKLCKENLDFKNDLLLKFIGDISVEVKKEISDNNLINNSTFQGYVTHKKAIQYQKRAQVLLLLIPNVKKAEGILTGKLFEYLTAKRPILAISPKNNDLSKILNETRAGKVIGFEDSAGLELEILALYQKYKEGSLKVNSRNIAQFHRKELTEKLSKIIKSLK